MNFKLIFLIFCLLLPSHTLWAQWWTADSNPVGLAPEASEEPQAIVQIYAARVWGWRGYFAVHTWVATKEKNAGHYVNYEVMGFRVEKGHPVIRVNERRPDRRWAGNDPSLLFELRGPTAEKMIPQIKKAVSTYPYQDFYRIWPGPNSNTFVSHIIRNTSGIHVELPPTAIGKDWIGEGQPMGLSETQTGLQFSLFGLLGATVGLAEGIEINLLGMTFGVDILRPAVKLPFAGRLGFNDLPAIESD